MASISREMAHTMMHRRMRRRARGSHHCTSIMDLKTMSSEMNMPEGGMAVMQSSPSMTIMAPVVDLLM